MTAPSDSDSATPGEGLPPEPAAARPLPRNTVIAPTRLTDAERQRVLVEWNATASDYPRESTLPEVFSQVVARFPDHVAVEFGDARLTYRQLDARANQLAWHLRRLGVDADTCVALAVERSLELVVALVAILKAGGAYVPLDPTYPRERLAAMVEDARPRVLVTTRAFVSKLPEGLSTVLLEELSLSGEPTHAPPSRALPDTLAYVDFTSGSTGRPKGVGTTHQGVLRNQLGVDYARFGPDETLLLLAPISFDASTFEIWGALLYGARLVVMPPQAPSLRELAQVVRDTGVTTLWLTTGLFSQVVEEHLEVLRGVRQVLTGGDVIPPAHVRRVVETLGLPVTACYGTTETTVFATAFTTRAASQVTGTVPIGGPINNLRTYVLDEHGEPVPVGVTGELFIGGEGLARGYVGQPALTAGRFVPDPFSGTPGARMYRTGDLVRWRDGGVLDFVGRADAQVKVRGFRIELPEVESALLAHPSVLEAVVVAREESPGDKRLVGYVVPVSGGTVDAGELRAALKQRLPEFMVPSVVVVLESLPLTANAKVDRKALAALPLPAQAYAPQSLAPGQEPRGPVEEVLAQFFCHVLGLEVVARDASFFDLGGHSLSASRLVARVRQAFNVELPLATLFAAHTVADLARELSEGNRAGVPPLPAPEPRPEGAPALASGAQERMWFLHQLQPELRAYNFPEAVELRGALDVDALEGALRLLLERHPTLRTPLVVHEGRPVPRPQPVPERVLHVEDCTASGGEVPWHRLREESARAFDLERGPLYRFRLYRLGAEHHVLLLVMHHIVMDGMSLDILVRELGEAHAALRERRAPALPAPELDYADVVAWQRTPAVEAREEADVAYWKQQLAGAPSRLVLPTDRPRPAVLGDRGASTQRHRFPPELTRALASVCRRHQVTPFMALYAAFAVLLQRYSGQDELCVGTPVSGRAHPAVEDVVGLFINTVVLRTRVDTRATFADLLSQVRATALEAFSHQQAPFERVVEALHVERSLSHSPLFQVMFDLSRLEHPLPGAFPELDARSLHLDPGASPFELSLTVYKVGEHYDLFLQYRTELFEEASIERMRAQYFQLLAHALESPEAPLTRLSLLAEAERQRVVREFNETQRPFDSDATIASLFLASAARTPDAVALVTPEGTLTFSQLAARASRLASHLAGLGARPEAVVGVCLERSVDCVVALLAVHLSGAGCLPLEPSHPAARRAFLLRQSGASLVVSRPSFFEGAGAGVPLVQPGDESLPHAVLATPRAAGPDNLAYLLYTSGSTGEPKGVELTQRNVVHCFAAFDDFYATSPGHTWAASGSLSFDIHLEELLFSLTRGARVVLRQVGPLGLGRDIVQHGITHIVITPSSLAAAFEEPGAPEALRRLSVLVAGGEVLPDSLVRQLAFTTTRLVNTYGPTETSINVAAELSLPTKPVRLGRPLDRCQLYVLDESLQPLPVGVPGEVFIGGTCLGRGYKGRADLTAERFIPDAFSGQPGARLYRTGDRARWNDDGSLSFLGRTDFQLKVRGVRVELEEIEAALLRLSGVRQAAVVARQGAKDTELAAYLVLESAGTDVRALRKSLASVLPEAMVPSRMLVLDALPTTTSGKADRKALAALPLESAADLSDTGETAWQPPRGPVEELLALLFGQVLGREKVARDADFFSLGGHSLSATRLVARVRQSFGVELPLAALFTSPTVESLAQVLAAHQLARVPPLPAPTPRPAGEPPLPSFAQERVWFLHQLHPELRAYLVPEAVELRGALDIRALEGALRLLLERHASLRSTFVPEEGRPALRVGPLPSQVLQVEDAAEADVPWARLRDESTRPFSLEAGPLYRFRLFRLGAEHHVLLLVLHHILVDGLTLDILMRELAQAYTALSQHQQPTLPPVQLVLADVAAWQRTPAVRAHEEAHLEYWKQQLAGAPALLTLPTDRPRPPVLSDSGALTRRHRLSPQLSRALASVCRQQQVTLFMALNAAFAMLLQRYSGQDELCVGTPVSGRAHPAVEDVVGLFINTVVLRTRVDTRATFADLLSQVRATALEAFSHQQAPFERVVEALHVERSLSHAPLFQVLFDLNRVEQGLASAFSELSARPLLIDNGTSLFDLVLTAVEDGDGYELFFRYQTELFDAATPERMLGHYVRLLEHALEAPEQPVGALSLLSPAERQRVVHEFNATHRPFDEEATLASLLRASAERTPDAVALVTPEVTLTFSQLLARASRLASHLAALGARPESVVGVCLERSADNVIALLAVHLSGAACLPLEPSHPAVRRAFLLRQSGARLVVSRPAFFAGVETGLTHVEPGDESRSGAVLAPPVPARPEHLAYVLYTSGSTGEPKGAELTQRNLVHCFAAFDELYATAPGHVWAASSSLSFDMHLEELLFSLTRGARVVLRQVGPLGLGRDIVQHGITHIVITPSSLAAAFEEPGAPEALRRLSVMVTGGEALPDALVRQLALTTTRIVNAYGPTETSVAVALDVCVAHRPVSLGRPADRSQLYVLDAALRPLPVGVPGELYIGGSGLGRGYRGRADLTAERFIPDPFSTEPGARLYRVGDRARWNEDGTLTFLGRTDFQLKVRGARVELEEVEAALLRLSGVRQAAVVARQGAKDTELVAYLVLEKAADDVRALRRSLASVLPEAMVPSRMRVLDALPTTTSGKVDRKALTALPLETSDSGAEATALQSPRGPVEELLALLFGQVLGREKVSRDADFFSLGGHSLSATRLVARIRQSFGVELPLAALFTSPTVETLARTLSAQQLVRVPPLPAPTSRPASEPPLPTFAQERLWFLHQLQPELRAYIIPEAVELRGALDLAALEGALRLLLERHASLRTAFVSDEGRPAPRLQPMPSQVLHVEEAVGAAVPWERLREESTRHFSMERGPLYHFHLFRLGAEHHVLLLVLHHILVDGLSLDVLMRELAQAYAALSQQLEPVLPPVSLDTLDVAAWQRTSAVRAHEEAHLDYWKRQLAGAPTLLSLPLDKPRPAARGDSGALTRARRLSPELSRTLASLCRQHQVTPFMPLCAAFMAVLQRYSGQHELCVGTPVSGRSHPATEEVVGLFINTVVLRAQVSPDLRFSDLLSQVRATTLEAFSHQAAPFERVVQELQVERATSHSPLVQVMFEFNRVEASLEGAFPGLDARQLPIDTRTSQLDLALYAIEDEAGFTFTLEHSTDLFEEATAERMLAHYLQLLEGALLAPQTPVARLPLLTRDERDAALREARPVSVEPPASCVHEVFAAQARRAPERVALSFDGGQWTYGALATWTNRAARRLAAQGVELEALVAVVGPRDEALVRGVLAVHTAGGAHLPLDAQLPPARVAQLLAESQAPFLLATGPTEALVSEALALMPPASRPRRLSLDALESESAEPLTGRASPEALAYVLFTSGSTGVPKGVMVHHQGMLNHILGMCEGLGIRESDVIAQTAALSFDISVWQMLGALTLGATTLMVPDDVSREPRRLATELDSRGATVVELVPSVLQALLEDTADAPPAFARLRCMATIGEALPPAVCRAWFERYPGVTLVNAYGPAECSDTATLHPLQAPPAGTSTPIGRPKRGMEVHVLDEALHPVPLGVVGELYIGGIGVGRGYRHRPELTAERFVPDPFAQTPGARLYRTGDLGRRLPDGGLEFVTRADFQVKVRGMRIELGEVEAALTALPSVRACVVTARERRPGDKELVAWVVPVDATTSESSLREALGQRLPAFMVPSRLVVLGALPLNANGKVDRKALATRALPVPSREDVGGEPPQGPMEALLAGLFRQLLGVDEISRDADFFSLGGHSLSATRLVARVRQELGVELPLSAFFASPTVAGLARNVALAPRTGEPRVRRAQPRQEAHPASGVQEGVWYALQLPDAPPFSLTLGLALEGDLRPDLLEAALAAVVERNDTLRSVFFLEKGTVFVRTGPPVLPLLTRTDLSHLSPDAALEAARAAQGRHDHLHFDVARGPLYRFELLRLDAAGTRHVLVLSVSHLVIDALGFQALMEELAAAYQAALAGHAPLLPPLELQYADVMPWRRGEDPARDEAGLASWKQALTNAPPVLDLPLDFPRRAPALNDNMRAVRVSLSAGDAAALRELARREGVSSFTAVLALTQAWLHRLSGQGHVVVASPFSGRTLPETERMAGYFANVLPLCTDVSGNPSFRGLLQRVQAVVAHASTHQEVPFKRISDAVLPEGPRTAPPLAQALLLLEATGTPSLGGLTVSELETGGVIPAYDVVVNLVEDAHGALEGSVSADGALFTPESGERMARAFEQLVASAVRAPDAPLSRLPLLSGPQRAAVLAALDGGTQAIPPGACIHTLFEAQVRRTPTWPAVAHGETTWSYAELNARANHLARRLLAQGLRPEERVGVVMEPSAQALAVLLGILKAGGAYVPMDAGWPEPRKLAVLERAGIRRLWVDAEALAEHYELVPLAEVPPQPASLPEDLGPGPREVPDAQLAYIVFTSGSTGEPKGVMVEHRSVVNHNLAIVQRFGLCAGDRMLNFAPLTFDAAAEDLYPPLVVGGTVVLRNGLVPAHTMTPYLEELGITLISLPPTYIEEWIRQMETLGQRVPARLKLLAPGGDVLKRETFEAWVRVGGGHAPWVNVYGPTECTITSATCDIPGAEGVGTAPTFPIGRPIPRVRFYLLDEHLEPVPPGLPGSVYIGGAALSRGYLGAPHATAERFIPDPFSGVPGARMYLTGDLARLLPDGRLRFLGRVDHQVKIRGFRIELSEIETCLRRAPQVEEAVVVARASAAGVQSLYAYVQAPAAVRAEGLREHVAAQLPAYMVPAAFVVLEKLPINANGKVDRNALPALEAAAPSAPLPTAAPAKLETAYRTTLELTLQRLWQEILERPGVSVTDDFFVLGGDSIVAMRLLARLEEEFGIPVPLAVIFQNPTLKESAEALLEHFREGPPVSSVVRLASRGLPETAAPLFLFHGGDGEVYHYRDLVPLLEPRFRCFGIQAPETLTPDRPLASFDERVAAYARDVRAVQPHGPYRLVGFSYGGYPALGVATLLEAQGEQVELLAMVDTLTSQTLRVAMPTQGLEPVLAIADEYGVYDEALVQELAPLAPEAKWDRVAERARVRGMASPHVVGRDLARVWRILGEVLTPQAAAWNVTPPAHVRPLLISCAATLAEVRDETLGWERHLSRARLELLTLPGDHATLLHPPRVEELARQLLSRLVR
ncbi:non-ribosomal peptide synthetase [Pyxidicoccus xibeiensis]|uniref:non-ribosomal peptide synthetase n=1 Tax=Pyxidicoccus xibeiensis TaxID=2906759 RepID=UPI0020A8055A|nr:non-ribosomal peptide synthetase [Pyxidicoccus xibeiensis]MCP3138672.1 amino acid adenylation domain-containing protein [Pyxidicoccus xibeiensis]